MTWRMARSLEVLLAEINAAAPNRSKISDGGIGDAAHASRGSDHNPWMIKDGVGIVRARDFTHDPAGGLDCNELAHQLAQMVAVGAHPALRSGAYIIWNGQIMSTDRRKEGWRPYTGSNPHDHHLHLSVTTDAAAFDSLQPWGVMKEDDMFEPEDKARLARIERKLDTFRKGERARQKTLLKRLDQLEKADLDDATKAQVRAVRADIQQLLDETEEDLS